MNTMEGTVTKETLSTFFCFFNILWKQH